MEYCKLKIALFFGGNNRERNISIETAANVLPALRLLGHHVQAFDTLREQPLNVLEENQLLSKKYFYYALLNQSEQGRILFSIIELLLKEKFDLVFLGLHGGYGEDGHIQAFLDMFNIPYTGSGCIASGICMNKAWSKHLFLTAGINTPKWKMFDQSSYKPELIDLSFPLVAKPNHDGSTFGVEIVNSLKELSVFLEKEFQYSKQILIEEFIVGRELTVGVLNNIPLAVGEILIAQNTLFDYGKKYLDKNLVKQFPANVVSVDTIRETALLVHRTIGLGSYSRVDFRLDLNGRLWCLEANSLPGLTVNSLFPKSAAAHNISFHELCQEICELALDL